MVRRHIFEVSILTSLAFQVTFDHEKGPLFQRQDESASQFNIAAQIEFKYSDGTRVRPKLRDLAIVLKFIHMDPNLYIYQLLAVSTCLIFG